MRLFGYEIEFPSVNVNVAEALVSGLAGAALNSYLEGDNTSAASYATGAALGVTSVVLFKGMAQASAAAGASLRDLCRKTPATSETVPAVGSDAAATLTASSSTDVPSSPSPSPSSPSPLRLKKE